jgi:ribonuclease D
MGNQHVRPIWVDSPAAVAEVCRRARATGVVCVDTEADSFHSYFHKLCLIQLSFAGEHVLLDPLALGREGLQPFAALLADAKVEKVLHGADYDLRVLHRDLGARVVGLRDTQVAAQLIGEPQTGLATLVAKELGIELDKQFQRADWGERPLAKELLAYAAADTAHLEALRDKLTERLAALGRLSWWEEECEALEGIEWEAPRPDPLAFERPKGARRLRGEARDRFAALFAWRERMAAEADVPPFRVLQTETMLALTQAVPPDLATLASAPAIGKAAVRRYGAELLRLLAHAPPAFPAALRERPHVDRAKERRVRQVRDVRDAVAKEIGIEPGVLAPRAALESVAERLPHDAAALRSCLGRRWRTEVLAARLLPEVATWEAGGAEPQ